MGGHELALICQVDEFGQLIGPCHEPTGLEFWLEVAADVPLWLIVGLALILNAVMILTSVALWKWWARGAALVRPSGRRDYVLTASTWVINSGVLVVAWWLYRQEFLTLADPTVVGLLTGSAYLLVMVDVIMYAVHRMFHHESLYERFHAVHHRDGSAVNHLSLFVMHPLEAAGFGGLMLGLMLLIPVSLLAVSLFLAVNLVVGTAAHLPAQVGARSGRLRRHYLDFHGTHHAEPNTNYGFFTSLPDRLGKSQAG